MMKKNKKQWFAFLLAGVFCVTFLLATGMAYGYPGEEEKSFPDDGYGTIRYLEYLEFEGNRVALYPVYENKAAALENFKAENEAILQSVAAEYGLQAYTVSNFDSCFDLFYEYAAKNTESESAGEFMRRFEHFYDIYENNGSNAEIYDYLIQNGYTLAKSVSENGLTTTAVSKTAASTGSESDQVMTEAEFRLGLKLLLPYDCGLFDYSEGPPAPKTRASSQYNILKAVAYADDYARTRNPAYKDYPQDCTNFVSQIVAYGGYPQNFTFNPETGWWFLAATKSSSSSWKNADKFVKYFGIFYKTTNHQDFSEFLDKGDVIAVDSGRDGSYGHVGFVMAKQSCLRTFSDSGKTYYNYKVAQHTGDYIAWTSSEENDWEFEQDKLVYYAIIRLGY